MTEQSSNGLNLSKDSASNDEWYYSINGTRKGPISEAAMRELIAKNKIDSTDLVWKAGQKDWQTVRESDLGSFVASEPPPLVGGAVSNTIVWIIAFVPLILGSIEAGMAYNQNISNIGNAMLARAGQYSGPVLGFGPYMLVYIVLGTWDAHNLKRAGYASGVKMRFLAALLTPIYLFVRAKLLKQRPTYAITWIALFIISLLMVFSVQNGY